MIPEHPANRIGEGLLDLIRPSPLRVLQDRARIATLLGIALYIIGSWIYLELGQANTDEGWYLYASKLVFQGALPYRDFAYTQMPLLPYIYGVLQIVAPSLLLGRLTSIFISLGTLGMSVVIARRYAGARAGAIAALLFAAFTFGIYYDSIVKTYALVSFFFTAALFVLSSNLKDTWKYPLALLYAFAAALVRFTALFFLAPILLYVLVAAPRLKTRALMLLESAAATLVAGFFLLPDWPTAQWNLLDSHLSHWGSSPISDRVKDVLTARLPEIVHNFGPVLVLCAAALYFILLNRDAKSWRRDPAPLLVATVGLILFGASHLANGIWEIEYLAPALIAFLPILAIALSRFYVETESASRAWVPVALIAVIILLPLGESTQHTDLTGGLPPLAEIDQVADFVDQNSQPTDKVLTLESLYVAVDANRAVLPGFTLAQFSLQDVDTATAQQLHVVNYELVSDAIKQKAARILVLTDGDLGRLTGGDSPDSGDLQFALDQNYYEAETVTDFGQFDETVHIYLSR